MKEITDYGEVFEKLVQKTTKYLTDNNLKAMILGISGGIDSTVVAVICHEVNKRTDIPLIGRSLPTKFNKEGETTTADLVGKAFCNDYKVFSIEELYNMFLIKTLHKETGHVDYSLNMSTGMYEINKEETLKFQTPIANGNIQARLRMIYLYNLASIHGGLVMDTDNLTENNLGYFTIHGDVGDFNPIGCLWKTEIFELARWIYNYYYDSEVADCKSIEGASELIKNKFDKARATLASALLKPTAGLGITDSDLDEIGAESYEQVDGILQEILAWKGLSKKRGNFPESIKEQREMFLDEQQMLCYPIEVIIAVTDRHFKSEFKRKQLPIKIERDDIFV